MASATASEHSPFAPFTALLASSLMLRTRSHLVAWSRVLLGTALAVALFLGENNSSNASAPGLEILAVLARIAGIGLGAVVLTSASAAITEEKEQSTLGLLRLTGLSAAGILGAKALARLGECWLLLAVSLPMALIAATLGGVTVTQVLAVYCALATWFAFLISLGLFWSSAARSGSVAAGASLVSLALVAAAISAASLTGSPSSAPSPWIAGFAGLGDLTVFARLDRVLATAYAGGIWDHSDALHLWLGAGLMTGAWLIFPAIGDAETTAGSLLQPRAAPPGPAGGGRPRWLDPPRCGLGRQAIAWKEFHGACGGHRGQVIALGALGVLAVLANRMVPGLPFLQAVLIFAVPALVLLTAFHLARTFNAELRGQTFDALIALPLHPSTLFTGKLEAVARFNLPFAILAGLAALLSSAGNLTDDAIVITVVAGAATLMLWYGSAFLSLVLPSAFAPGSIVALAGFAVGIILASFLVTSLSDTVKMWTAMVLALVTCIELHWAMVERLRVMAEG
jgi:hypothetical protein